MSTDLLESVRQAELQLASTKADETFARNLAFFETTFPAVYATFAEYSPASLDVRLHDAGYVELVDLVRQAPVYPGDPREHAREQCARFRANPNFLTCTSAKTSSVVSAETNAHIANSNSCVDLLDAETFERPTELPTEVGFVLMLGLGLGHQIEAILEHTEVHNLCIVEPEPDALYASMFTVDWAATSRAFSGDGRSLELIVGEDVEGCFARLDDYVASIGPFNLVQPYVMEHLTSPKLHAAFGAFFDRIMPKWTAALGYFDDERVGLAHTAHNLAEGAPLLRSADRDDTSVDKPAFIVANGPSLDAALETLKSRRGQAVVFSCGSALGSLAKAGIKPDFHVEMERSRPVVEWLEHGTTAEFREGITLLALNTVHPEVPTFFDRAGIAMKSNDVGTTWASTVIRDEEADAVVLEDANPTVTNCALAIATAMGFREAYFFGLDLGFASDGSHHSALSAHYDVKPEDQASLGLYDVRDPKNIKGQGNFGGEVTTTPVYVAAAIAITRLIGRTPGLVCYNTSDGLAIDGARPMRVADMPFRPEFDARAFAAHLFDRRFRDVAGSPDSYAESLGAVFDGSVELMFRLRRLASTPIETRGQGLQVLSGMQREVSALLESPETRSAGGLMAGSISVFGLHLAQALHRFQNESRSVDLYRRCMVRFAAFLGDAMNTVMDHPLEPDSRTRDLKTKMSA